MLKVKINNKWIKNVTHLWLEDKWVANNDIDNFEGQIQDIKWVEDEPKAKIPEKPLTFDERYPQVYAVIRTLSERVEGLNNRLLRIEKQDEPEEIEKLDRANYNISPAEMADKLNEVIESVNKLTKNDS